MKREDCDALVGVHWEERSESQQTHAMCWVSFLNELAYITVGRGSVGNKEVLHRSHRHLTSQACEHPQIALKSHIHPFL